MSLCLELVLRSETRLSMEREGGKSYQDCYREDDEPLFIYLSRKAGSQQCGSLSAWEQLPDRAVFIIRKLLSFLTQSM